MWGSAAKDMWASGSKLGPFLAAQEGLWYFPRQIKVLVGLPPPEPELQKREAHVGR